MNLNVLKLYTDIKDYLTIECKKTHEMDGIQIQYFIHSFLLILLFLYLFKKGKYISFLSKTTNGIISLSNIYRSLFDVTNDELELLKELYTTNNLMYDDSVHFFSNEHLLMLQNFLSQLECNLKTDFTNFRPNNADIFEEIYISINESNGVVNTPRLISNFISFNAVNNFFKSKFNLDLTTNITDKSQLIVTKETIKELKILDISVGCGSFYLELCNILFSIYKDNIGVNTSDETIFTLIIHYHLYGIYIDPLSLLISKIRLIFLLLSKKSCIAVPSKTNIISNAHLIKGNAILGYINKFSKKTPSSSLLNFIDKNSPDTSTVRTDEPFFYWDQNFKDVFDRENSGFDIIVGNPPYIGYGKIDAKEKSFLEQIYSNIYTGLNDYYYFFIWRAYELLNEKGVCSLIVPRYFLEARYANKLRNALFTYPRIEFIIDFREYKVFKGVGINVTILTFSKDTINENPLVIVLKQFTDKIEDILKQMQDLLITKQSDNTHLLHSFKFSIKNTVNNNNTFIIYSNSNKNLLDKIKEGTVELEKISHIGTGFHTGKDKIFTQKLISENGRVYGTYKNSDITIKIPLEEELIKKIIKTIDILPFIIDYSEKYVIMTYHGVDIENYPNTYKYLSYYKEELEDRYEVKRKIAYWYEIAQIRNKLIFDLKLKIVCPYKAKYPRFAIDTEQRFSSIDCTVIGLKDNISLDPYYLLALLNSKIFAFYISLNTKKVDAKKLELYPKNISKFPVKLPKTGEEIKLMDKIIKLSKELSKELYDLHLNKEDMQVLRNKGIIGVLSLGENFKVLKDSFKNIENLIFQLYNVKDKENEINQVLKNTIFLDETRKKYEE